MDGVKKIVLISCIMAVIISIFDILYPGKKFAVQIKLIFSVVFMLSFVVSITNINFELETFDTYSQNISYTSVNENVKSVFKKTAENNISDALKSMLKERGFNTEKIETSINILSDNSISINEVKIMCRNPGKELYNLVKSEVESDTIITIYEIQE